tara:strand:- start:904 stop:2079 length:1176 start_codon:yes stop_codon:yes gene_type:complete
LNKFFNTRQKVNLTRSLFLKTSPAYVQFYITARCNLACEQCNIIYADADSQEMSISQIRKMAKNMSEIGVCMVLLIGGEPFVRHDIADIIKAFTDVNIHVRMQTNGLASKKALKECVKVGGHDISISLDSLEQITQEAINGEYPKSWERAIKTVATINEVFPENGTAFFGTVLMHRNLFHIEDVIEFATRIGWGVSLVPVHTATTDNPAGFRTFDDDKVCQFPKESYNDVKKVLEDLKQMKNKGYNLYDSDEYLDDIYRFITGEPIEWRRRNNNVCDSPSLYFAIEPNGNIKPCCDFKLKNYYPVYDDEFPKLWRSGKIHQEVFSLTRNCSGCMYGSYPEITVTARYLKPMVQRFLYFNKNAPKLKKISYESMVDIANEIFHKNEKKRRTI